MVKGINGRPPKLWSDEQTEQLGLDLIDWITNNPKEWMWVKWYYNKYNMTRQDFRELMQRPKFRTHYETARKILVQNMIQNTSIHHSYGHRYLAMYDDELLSHEEEIKDRDTARKAKEAQSVSLQDLEKLKAVVGCIQSKSPSEDKAP